jgi:hypothetical protein
LRIRAPNRFVYVRLGGRMFLRLLLTLELNAIGINRQATGYNQGQVSGDLVVN